MSVLNFVLKVKFKTFPNESSKFTLVLDKKNYTCSFLKKYFRIVAPVGISN